MDYNFLTATVNDLDEVFSIYEQKEKWLKSKNINQWVNYTKRYTKNKFLKEISNGTCYVIKTNNKITAVAIISFSDECFWKDDNKDSVFIKNLASIKQGHGKLLLDELENVLKDKGIKYIKLDCIADNKKLVEYYTDLKFKLITSNKIYSVSKSPAALFIKTL